jgi:CRISPR-associated endonuclease Cas1
MNSADDLYGRVVNGTLVISGNGPSLKVENGVLVVRDGPRLPPPGHQGPVPPLAERMVTLRVPRAGCPIKRIIVTRPEGFATFAALEWLSHAGISLTMLNWHGEVLLATAPPGPDRPAMRRAQALAAGSENGLAIVRELLRHKLAGQAAIARLLGGDDAALLIDRLAGEVATTTAGMHAMACEAAAATAYWRLWSGTRMRFARRDHVPDHWATFGARRPPGSYRPRNATTAPGALLNYLYGVAVAQMTAALIGAGLDPGIGMLHADKEGRASLAYDAVEALRPYIEAWLLALLAETVFAKRDFYEEGDGTIRLTRPLSGHLALTAALWARGAETVAAWLADCLTRAARPAGMDDAVIEKAETGFPVPAVSSPLPAVIVAPSFPPLPAPFPALPMPGRPYRPALAHEVMPRACLECGRALSTAGKRFCSGSCAALYRAAMRRLPVAEEGRFPVAAVAAIRAAEVTRSAKTRRTGRLRGA